MIRFLIVFLVIISNGRSAVYEQFPGFKSLYERADFVGIVTLVKRDIPKDEEQASWGDWIGPHRFFEISSVKVFKGAAILQSQVARLADRRLAVENGEGKLTTPPLGEILTPEMRFLVFLTGLAEGKAGRYRWDELRAEGAVLPVSPKTNLEMIDVRAPFPVFEQIVKDYTAHCKALYEHAQAQERLLEPKGGEPAPAGKPSK